MKCPSCATENPDVNRFCLRCGAPVDRAPSRVGAEAPGVSADRPNSAPPPEQSRGEAVPLTGFQYGSAAPSFPFAQAPSAAPLAYGSSPAWRGPFASRGLRVDRGSVVYAGRANGEAGLTASMVEALRMFRAYQEYVDGKSVGLERRSYVTATKGTATIAVYATSIRGDLYASWTAFSRQDVDVLRVIGLFLLALTFSLPGGVKFDLFSGSGIRWDFASYLGSVVVWVILLGILLLWTGLTFRRDPLGFLRAPLNEFQLDDLHSLREATEVALRAWDASATPVSPKPV